MNILHVAMLFVTIIGAIYAFYHLINSISFLVKSGNMSELVWGLIGFILLSVGCLLILVASVCGILNILEVV